MNRLIGTDLYTCVNDMLNDHTILPLCILTKFRYQTPKEWKDFVQSRWDKPHQDKAEKIIFRLIEEKKIIQPNLSDSCWSNIFVSRL